MRIFVFLNAPFIRLVIPPLLLLLLNGCVGAGNIFQDGHTVGKGNFETTVSVSYNFVPDYSIDTEEEVMEIKDLAYPLPWGQADLNFGVTNRLDIGGNFGLGLLSGGMGVFGKFALLPDDRRLGISLYTSGNIAGVGGEEALIDSYSIFYYSTRVAVPVSFRWGPVETLIIQPFYLTEFYDIETVREDVAYEANLKYPRPGIGLGWIRDREDRSSSVFYSFSLSIYDHQVYPTAGVGFIF